MMPLDLGVGLSFISGRPRAAPTNLLEGLPWIQGADTILTSANGRVRIAKNGANPRGYKNPTGLIVGAQYRIIGNVWQGTNSGTMFFRVSETSEIPDGNIASGDGDFVINNRFVAPAASLFIGLVAIATDDDEYAEISDGLMLVRE